MELFGFSSISKPWYDFLSLLRLWSGIKSKSSQRKREGGLIWMFDLKIFLETRISRHRDWKGKDKLITNYKLPLIYASAPI